MNLLTTVSKFFCSGIRLKQAHEQLLIVLNSLDAIVYVADMNSYEVLFINTYTEIIHPEDREKWRSHIHAVPQNGEVEAIEFRIITKNGETSWIHHVCRSVFSKDGKNLGVRGSNRDITKRMLLKKEIKVLRGFLPICASCKKIRDDKGYWNQIESYIRDHSEAQFSHSICPDCVKKLYPDLLEKQEP
jgi:hypothetical protein